VDSALPAPAPGANPVIISRIIGGDPMGATLMNIGATPRTDRRAGLMRELTNIAEVLGTPTSSMPDPDRSSWILHLRRAASTASR
jgi:hypothetical protein